jgi:hypothetical protein
VTATPKSLPTSMYSAQLEIFLMQHIIIKSLKIVTRVMVYPCCELVGMGVASKSFFIVSAVSGVTWYLKLLAIVTTQ